MSLLTNRNDFVPFRVVPRIVLPQPRQCDKAAADYITPPVFQLDLTKVTPSRKQNVYRFRLIVASLELQLKAQQSPFQPFLNGLCTKGYFSVAVEALQVVYLRRSRDVSLQGPPFRELSHLKVAGLDDRQDRELLGVEIEIF